METETEPRIILVYQGIELSYFNGKPNHVYRNKETDEVIRFSETLTKSYNAVGALMEVTKTKEGVKGPYAFRGMDNENPDLGDWKTQHWANQKLLDAKKAAERNKKGIEEELEALRIKYKGLRGSQRSLFIASIVYEITK